MIQTIPDLLADSSNRFAERPLFYYRAADGTLGAESYAEVASQVKRFAAGLVALGVEAGQRVVILSENRREWLLADLATLCVGATNVPLYPSLPSAQIEPLIAQTKAQLVIVEDRKQLAKVQACLDRLPTVQRIIVFEANDVPADDARALSWGAVATEDPLHLREVERRCAALGPDDLATVIFTSGTTGVPKGAMLTQDNFAQNAQAALRRIVLHDTDRLVAILPMSHVFMRLVVYLGMAAGAGFLFNESLRQVLADQLLVRPTIPIIVPRMAEMFRDRILVGLAEKTGLKGRIARWAVGLAPAIGAKLQERQPLGTWLGLQRALAEKLAFGQIRAAVGWDQVRFAVSGGAALPPAVCRWWQGVGVNLFQGYGLTETSPVIAVNPSEGIAKFETVGQALDTCEIRVEADGELVTRGPCVMKGYLDLPEETAEVLDADGWFHTGDLVEVDGEGYIRIVGRKKEIMVLATGKNVAPVPIEEALASSALIDRAVVFGDGQNVVTALVVPNYDALWAAVSEGRATLERDADGAWLGSREVRAALDHEVEQANSALAAFERVAAFAVLPRDLTLEQEELTPTLKVRRAKVARNWAAQLAQLVGGRAG